RMRASSSGLLQVGDLVHDHRPVEALELERADLLGRHEVVHGGVDALADEDLARRRLGAEPEGEVGDAADGRVVAPALEANRTDRRVALRDPHAEVEIIAPSPPLGAEHPDPRPRSPTASPPRRSSVAFQRAISSACAATVSCSALIRSIERTRAERAAWSTGLVRYSSAPASSPATMSFASVMAVTRMIGVKAGPCSFLSRRQTSIPSTFGIMMSSR